MWRSASDSVKRCFAMCGPSASAVLAVALVLLWGGVARGETYRIYHEGQFEVLRCDREGRTQDRYTGFSEITDVAPYGDHAFLVVEERPGRVTAVTLEGRTLWKVHLEAARYVSVVDDGRLLVCQSRLDRVVEVDTDGKILWDLDGRIAYPAGAVRLPDGSTAVVQGKRPFGVYIVDRDGREVWKGTEHLMQPRSLTRLPGGDLVTSGFDYQHAVIFTPYSEAVRWLDHCPHCQSVEATPEGDLLIVSPEHQAVRFWREARRRVWEFRTLYPPGHASMLPDGSVLVSIERTPDKAYDNVARARERAARPVAAYWKWLGWGALGALLLALLLRGLVLLDLALGLGPRRGDGKRRDHADMAPEGDAPIVTAWRRAELVVAAFSFLGLVAWGAWLLAPIQLRHDVARGAWHFSVAGAAGGALAWLAYRAPRSGEKWRRDLLSGARMAWPAWGMWALWGVGLAASVATGWELWHGGRDWATGTWAAGVLLLLLGSLEPPRRAQRVSPWATLGFVLLIAPVAALRLWGLDAWPPNLHHDMALTSLQAFDLLDGEAPGLFTNGWAKIPMAGYVWPALWCALYGRGLAAARLGGAMASIVVLLGVYVLVRRLYGRSTAVVAVVLLGVSHAFLHYSRIQAYMAPVAFQVVAVAALVEGIATLRYGWFALAGVSGGYSALCYHSGRVTPLVLLLVAVAFLLRHPRLFARRLPGFVFAALVALAVVAPQGIVYWQGKADPLGRRDQFPWAVGIESLETTVRTGASRVFGTFHFYPDRATQYGAVRPGMFAVGATLLVASLALALLRIGDVRNAWLLLWGLSVLIVGGVLTGDPPFWPRILAAWVPATILVARPFHLLWLAARGMGSRVVAWGVGILAVLFVASAVWFHLSFYWGYCHGIPPEGGRPRYAMQWSQTLIGRDLRHFGSDDPVYIVARQGGIHGAGHKTVQFFGWDTDMVDTRDISQYLPFEGSRPVVCYFLLEMRDQVKQALEAHSDARVFEIKDNLGNTVATRVVVEP